MEGHGSNVLVLDPKYCFLNPMDVKIDMEDGVVVNHNNEVLFRMEKTSSFGSGRILQNCSSETICLLVKKKLTAHGRWEIYKGKDTSQPSFIVKRPSIMTKDNNIVYHVFLPNNTEVSVCKIRASSRKNSCEIYTAESTLAKAGSTTTGDKDAMKVEIKASIDLAFIVSLLMIVDEKKNNKLKKVAKRTAQALCLTVSALSTSMEMVEMVDNMRGVDDDQEVEQTRAGAN